MKILLAIDFFSVPVFSSVFAVMLLLIILSGILVYNRLMMTIDSNVKKVAMAIVRYVKEQQMDSIRRKGREAHFFLFLCAMTPPNMLKRRFWSRTTINEFLIEGMLTNALFKYTCDEEGVVRRDNNLPYFIRKAFNNPMFSSVFSYSDGDIQHTLWLRFTISPKEHEPVSGALCESFSNGYLMQEFAEALCGELNGSDGVNFTIIPSRCHQHQTIEDIMFQIFGDDDDY